MFTKQILALGLAALGSATSVSLSLRAPSIPPRDDPFYAPPTGLESKRPGDILKTRAAANPLVNVINKGVAVNVKDTYQIMYRTTDSIGQAVAAVTTLIVPHYARTDHLLAYQVAYDSADNNCAPSYTLQQNNSHSGDIEQFLIAAALNQGWYVTTSDYEGLGAAFTAGVLSGQATLDSIRASRASTSLTGLESDARFGMMGYSGGSLASEWAAELQETYAPELKEHFVGLAIGGLTPNISSVLLTINKGVAASLAPTGIVGIASQYSNFSDYLEQHLIPSKKAAFYSVRDCSNTSSFLGQDIFSYFDNGEHALTDPIPNSVVQAGGIQGYHGKPQVPMYVYKGVLDEVSPVADTDALVKKYCDEGGVDIEYVRDLTSEHVTEEIFGSPGAFAWLKDRFAGVPVQQGCTVKDVAVSTLGLEAVDAVGDIIVAGLLSNLGLPLRAYVTPGA